MNYEAIFRCAKCGHVSTANKVPETGEKGGWSTAQCEKCRTVNPCYYTDPTEVKGRFNVRPCRCGSIPILSQFGDNAANPHHVLCPACLRSGPVAPTETQALVCWNEDMGPGEMTILTPAVNAEDLI